jgi:hypothetical protein
LELPPFAPPAPTDPDEKDNWEHLLDHMDDAQSWDGDDEDVFEVSLDIQIAIRDAMADIQLSPFDFGAWMRLQWLRDQEDYYGHWMAWIRKVSTHNGKYIYPSLFKKCSRLFQLPPKPKAHNDSSSSPLRDFSIGIGIGGEYGGGHHDNRDRGHDTHEPAPPQGRTSPTMPTTTEPH